MKNYLIIISSILFISCQDEITLDLPQAQNKLVIDGVIEPGFPPYVIISQNQGYFAPIDSTTYNDLYTVNVDSVKVWCYNSDGEQEIKILTKIETLDSLPPIYTDMEYFDNTSNYQFSKANQTYYLEIQWNDQVITSQTTIPNPTPLDCLWVEKNESAERDWKYDIRAIYSDPISEQNNIIVKSKRLQYYNFNETQCKSKNKPDFLLKIVDAGSDVLINGETFETYFPRPSDGGFPTGSYNGVNTRECLDGTTLEREKDIVLIKFCQIDEPSLKFWRGLVRQSGTNGNPFSEPMNLVSNINGGMGVFTGYGAVYYKIPIVNDTTIFEEYKPNLEDIF